MGQVITGPILDRKNHLDHRNLRPPWLYRFFLPGMGVLRHGIAGNVVALLALMLWAQVSAAENITATASVALHYGQKPPLKELSVFDIVVVEPDHVADPTPQNRPGHRLYAYVSVGEIHPTRSYAKDLPARWQRGIDPVWKSLLIDVSQPGYAEFFAQKIVAPLWKKGYRGFFLDTLDTYARIAAPESERATQNAAMQKGLVALIEKLHQRFPGIRLIANRGFELLPAIAPRLEMVAVESLFQGYDAKNNTYVEIPEKDRDWVLGQMKIVRETYHLPALSIDYVPSANRLLARQTAAKIRALGIVPWVTDHALETVGIGTWEILPRKILMLYDSSESPVPDRSLAGRYAAMPLEYLGYVPVFHDLNEDLPQGPLNDLYAGVVIWPNRIGPRATELAQWVKQRIKEGTRIAFLGQFGLAIDDELRKAFGLVAARPPGGALALLPNQSTVSRGFETRARPNRQDLQLLRIESPETAIVPLIDRRGEHYTGAALTPWGGFALNPFVVVELPGSERTRWVIDPFAFFTEALALPPMPAPDVTTENGRRLFLTHIDGDGFPSLAEIPGSPFAGAALRDLILKRYKLPTTMSVIEAEISPSGIYPQLTKPLEAIARDIFALPYVEIASHTFSHPFRWYRAEQDKRAEHEDEAYHLEVPGYRFDLKREIEGSAAYIRDRLAPPGKPVGVFLWSGDAEPTAGALNIAENAGLLNMNGGLTVATRANPSITAISPMGIERGGVFQTFAPVMNENVYTNLWTGPYYGFEKVIETFEITGAPRRLKPIGLYYHSYSASKKAGLGALEKIYGWALGQSPHAIFASDYIRKARDFRHLTVAREVGHSVPEGSTAEPAHFRIRSNGDLRTLRLPAELKYPDLTTAEGVAGQSWREEQPEARYLHLTGKAAEIKFLAADHLQKTGESAAPAPVYLFDANARLGIWERHGAVIRFSLAGHQALEFTLGGLGPCVLIREATDGQRSTALTGQTRPSGLTTFRLDHAAGTFATRCAKR